MDANWAKGYQRKAMALHGLGQLPQSYEAYEQGLQKDPNNAQIKSGMQAVKNELMAQSRGPGGPPGGGMGGGLGGMFGGPDAEAKLRADPEIAKYF